MTNEGQSKASVHSQLVFYKGVSSVDKSPNKPQFLITTLLQM